MQVVPLTALWGGATLSTSQMGKLSTGRSGPVPASAENSLLLLSPEVGFDDQAVQGEVQHERPHSGVEHGTGQQLVRQVNGEEVGLTGPV